MGKRHVFAATALAATMVVGFAAPASAHWGHDGDHRSEHHRHDGEDHHHDGHHGEEPGTVTVVADNLNNPRQVTVNDGSVYVAEAGTGGDACSARVTRRPASA